MTPITQAKLKHSLKYHPESGKFIYVNPPHMHAWRRGTEAGYVNRRGYVLICIDGTYYLAHRLAFLYMEGAVPPKHVDHINHVRSDNRWCNLRHATPATNNRNASLRKSNRSGVSGVRWVDRDQRWEVYIGALYGGCFTDFFEAVCVRKSLNVKHNFHPNHGEE